MIVKSIRLWRVLLPMKFDFHTAKGLVRERHTLVVEVITDRGISGFGEVVAFDTPFYTAETINTSEEWLRKAIPYFIGFTMNQPWDCYGWELGNGLNGLGQAPKISTTLVDNEIAKDEAVDNEAAKNEAVNNEVVKNEAVDNAIAKNEVGDKKIGDDFFKKRLPMAWAGLENALLHAFFEEQNQPMIQSLVKAPLAKSIPLGLVFGDMPIPALLAKIDDAIGQGCERVKIKLTPKDSIERLTAVRNKFPNLDLAADANRSFSVSDWSMVKAFDAYNLKSLEEPFELIETAAQTYGALPTEFWSGWQTPLSFDESVQSLEELKALHSAFSHCTNLRPLLNVKIGRLGGLREALRCIAYCREQGLGFWIGSMVESGISKILHVELAALPGVWMAGDLSDSKRYFEEDLIEPPIHFIKGQMAVPQGAGLGVKVNRDILQAYGKIIVNTSFD